MVTTGCVEAVQRSLIAARVYFVVTKAVQYRLQHDDVNN